MIRLAVERFKNVVVASISPFSYSDLKSLILSIVKTWDCVVQGYSEKKEIQNRHLQSIKTILKQGKLKSVFGQID